MYLKQMGQVALLTREQEVEISKRIEAAENEVRKIIYSLGFAGKEHIALAEKLLADPPRERFDRVVLDKKVDSRNAHLRALRRCWRASAKWIRRWISNTPPGGTPTPRPSAAARRRRSNAPDQKLQAPFPKFCFKHKVIEEMALVAENIHDKLQYSLRALADAETQRESSAQQHLVEAERQKIRALEEFVRMPLRGFSEGLRPAARIFHQGAPGQDRNGRGQPAPRHFHRQKIHQPRPVVPRPDPGRQHGLDEGRGKI